MISRTVTEQFVDLPGDQVILKEPAGAKGVEIDLFAETAKVLHVTLFDERIHQEDPRRSVGIGKELHGSVNIGIQSMTEVVADRGGYLGEPLGHPNDKIEMDSKTDGR
jgi:hypothetical protein